MFIVTQDDGVYGIWTAGEIETHRGKGSRRGRATSSSKEEEDKEAKEQQQQDDDEHFDTVAKIKLVHEGKRAKIFRVTGNLNTLNTKMIMANITPHIQMRVRVIYSFESVIYWTGGKIQPYSKT